VLGQPRVPVITGLIGNARWAGTPLAPVLEQARLLKGTIEVVFHGIDGGLQTIRDNTGIVSAGQTGTTPRGRRTDDSRAVRPQSPSTQVQPVRGQGSRLHQIQAYGNLYSALWTKP
jgi:hypothetical protein